MFLLLCGLSVGTYSVMLSLVWLTGVVVLTRSLSRTGAGSVRPHCGHLPLHQDLLVSKEASQGASSPPEAPAPSPDATTQTHTLTYTDTHTYMHIQASPPASKISLAARLFWPSEDVSLSLSLLVHFPT